MLIFKTLLMSKIEVKIEMIYITDGGFWKDRILSWPGRSKYNFLDFI